MARSLLVAGGPETDFIWRKLGVNWNLDPHRHERVSEGIREELDELISYELSDPRIGPATVAEVHLSPDFRRAHVMLLLVGSPEEQAATLAAVDHAKQFLRHQLAERLQLFHTPDLHFEAALPGGLGAKAPQILKRIRRGRPKPEKNSIS
jgi:ribosome-binding factor A